MATLCCSFSSRFKKMQEKGGYNLNTVAKRRVRVDYPQCRALYADDEGEFAPVSKGDGFSFYGGKYSDERDKTDDWWDRGNFIYAYSPQGTNNDVKEPLFGLKLGAQSQVSGEAFRWFYVEEGDKSKPLLLLLHGLGSQAYSFRDSIPVLASKYRTVAVDWLGCGFSDKPQSGYGFRYTMEEYAKALEALVRAFEATSVSLVVQGHFAPAVVEFTSSNPDLVTELVLINPPLSDAHTKLPSSLSAFTNPFLADIFAQDPYKASDGILAQAGYYSIKEEDKMVYRKPYLSSGSAGFALTSLAKVFKSELQTSVQMTRKTLTSPAWKTPVSILAGTNDKWLSFGDLKALAEGSKLKLVEFQDVGHHAQEDLGKEMGSALLELLLTKKNT